jgi:hypothetical protein
MRIRLVVAIDGEPARWQNEVERAYPGVPRVGEWVYLAENSDEGLMATPVAVVTWENDGVVALRVDVAAGPESVAYLETLGFTRIS